MSLAVTLHINSGLPNPSWVLAEEQVPGLMDRLRALGDETPLKASPGVPFLGYRGFTVSSIPLSPFAGTRISINRGIIDLGARAPSLFDPSRSIENWLLGSASGQISDAARTYVRNALSRSAEEVISPRDSLVFKMPSRSCVPMSVDAPTYDSVAWFNRVDDNCYNYANDQPKGNTAQPGRASGVALSSLSCPKVQAAALADGLVARSDFNTPLAAGEGWYVALAIRPATHEQEADYHFYRQDADGCWSHKPGPFPATDLDESSKAIQDPRHCNRGDYSVFCATFMVTNRSVVIR